MPGDRRIRVALDVGSPLPARCIGVASADVLGLEALEFLLVAKLVGLCARETMSEIRSRTRSLKGMGLLTIVAGNR